MRAIYNTCWIDPWAKIAEYLKNKNNIEPVYWIGYYNDNSEKKIPELFGNIVYQSRWDIWKGIFPENVEKKYASYNLDIDFLAEHSNFELIAINAMDRMDPDRHSFAFQERQRLFRNMLRKWLAVIDLYKIDIIIADRIPHRSYDYALYLICKKLNIKYLFLYDTFFPHRTFIQSKIDNIEDYLYELYRSEYKRFQKLSLQNVKNEIDKDIISRYEKCLGQYVDAVPLYMMEHARRHEQNSNIFKLSINFILEFLNIKRKKEIHIRRNKGFWNDFLDIHPYAKKADISIEKSKYNAFEYGFVSLKAIRYKKKLSRYYEKLALNPDYSIPYIFFAMHYQPEATSNPAAGIFVDQYLAIEQIASNLPEGWILYVKEHKSQFVTISEGHKARFRHLYDDLLKIKNVRLVPLDTDVFDLIDNSKAVATLTGTVGWEAIVRAKPVIVFGLAWYEACQGVLKINSNKDVSDIINFINNFRFDEKSVFSYLSMINQIAPLSNSYLGKGKDMVSDKDSMNNLLCLLERGLNL